MDLSPTRSKGNARRRAAGFSLFLAIAIAATLAPAAPVQAIGIPNSECVAGHNGFANVWNGSEWDQTFPANRSGKLLTVELRNIAREAGGTSPPIEVRLYGADESGTPVEPVLASTTVPPGSITADDTYHDYTANFEPASAAFLSKGKTYAIGVSTTDTVQNAWAFHDGNPCANGVLFGHYLGFTANPDLDAGLTTYVGPANDDFEHAQELVGQEVAEEGTTAGATRQTGEPDHCESSPLDCASWIGDHSVWFRWRAPHTGATTIDTCLGEIDSILAVYTGDELESLTRVADNNNDQACSGGPDIYGSRVAFEATAGTTYDIAVGDAGGAREKPFAIKIAEGPDTTPPETQIDSGPSGATTDASPSFAFSSSEPVSSFECRLDSTEEAAFAPCTSPVAYSSLALGAHTFEVRAIDAAENIDPTPAIRSFTVEAARQGSGSGGAGTSGATPPDTAISRARISQAKDQATFRFGSSEPGSTFLCRIDRKPPKPCVSPKSYRHLKVGKHSFSVEAVDLAGAGDPTPAVKKFKIRP